jgi:hypothetical protein
MLEAAEGGDIEAATEQLKRVLFMDARLDLSREWMRFVKKSPVTGWQMPFARVTIKALPEDADVLRYSR